MPYGRELSLQTGDFLFDETPAVDSFYVVLEGEIEISRLDGAEEISLEPRGRRVHRRARGAHGEDLDPQGAGRRAGRILEIDSETFRRVAVEVPDVADVFISGLARRMRYTQRAFRQQEKLAALGKLSAGLAHELNNPRRGRQTRLRRARRRRTRSPARRPRARRSLLPRRARRAPRLPTRDGRGEVAPSTRSPSATRRTSSQIG